MLVCFASVAMAADEILLKAKALLDGNEPQAAYKLLAPLQAERAGDPQYDYLLGVAALEVGRNTEAVFALERVLAMQPNNGPARAQIARAYFNLRETAAAKREFETVKNQPLPANIKSTIDSYLDTIDRVSEGERFSARFFLEFQAGWDSNVNSATTLDQVAIPAFGNSVFTLAPGATELHDGFISTAAGVSIRNPLSNGYAVIGGVSGTVRLNFQQTDFDTTYLDGYLGLVKRFGRETLSVVAQANMYLVDVYNADYRDALGATVQWTHDFDARNQLTAYLQYASLSFPEQTPRDANRTIGGVGYAHAFRGGDLTGYVGLYGGAEQAKDGSFDYLGNRILGLRFGGQKGLNERTSLFLTAAFEKRSYQGTDPFFNVIREDRQYGVGLGINYLLPKDWRLSPQVTWLGNYSNIDLNQYNRWQAFVALRRDW